MATTEPWMAAALHRPPFIFLFTTGCILLLRYKLIKYYNSVKIELGMDRVALSTE